MFNLEAITTSNLFSAVQILVVIAGFYFSWKGLKAANANLKIANTQLTLGVQNAQAAQASLDLAVQNLALGTSNAQAQLVNQMIIQGRELQFKFAELFHSGNGDNELKARRDQFIGTLLGYYSSCFELKSLLKLPANIENQLAADLSALISEEPVRAKWNAIKHLHSKEFAAYVERVTTANAQGTGGQK